MVQNIGISLEDEHTKERKDSSINFAPIYISFWDSKTDIQNYPFLSTIDAYGETLFNSEQRKHLVHELKSFRGAVAVGAEKKGVDLASILEEVITYVESLDDENCQLLRFSGD